MSNLNLYQGKRVFLTGHTGFKGGWLLAVLHKLGAHVKGYALAPEDPRGIYTIINGPDLCESVLGDIRNQEMLEQEICSFKPDFIFHLAAQPLVRSSYENPSYTFSVNILGTSYLLEAVSKLKNKCTVVVVTTDKVYENREWEFAYRENDRLGGHDPYSTSKACTELVTESFRKSVFNVETYSIHQKAVATARAGNVIGGGDFSKDRIVPDLIRSLEGKNKLKIRNPKSIRPWQHVLEPVVGYLSLGLLLEKDPQVHSRAFNFGPCLDDHISVEELVIRALKVWGSGTYEILKTDNLHESNLLSLDIGLSAKLLSWHPCMSSGSSIQKTMEWYRSDNPAKVTDEQIKEFLSAK